MKFLLVIIRGRGFTLMPLRPSAGMGVVYGAPMDVGAPNADPSHEQVQALLVKYTAAVHALYDDHKATFGYDAAETLVIE